MTNPCYEGWEGVMCSCNVSVVSEVAVNYYYAFYDDDLFVSSRNGTNGTNGTNMNGTIGHCSVTKLYLNRHNLRGSLSSSIGNLANMTHLHLGGNALSGSIPESLYVNVRGLEVLMLIDNR